MKIKNYFISLFANLDTKLAAYENHDAVIKASIDNIKQARARGIVKLNRIKSEQAQLAQQLEQLEIDIKKWLQRAKDLREQDQEKAITCLKHKQLCETNLKVKTELHERHCRAVVSLENEIRAVDLKLTQLETRRSVISSREIITNVKAEGSNIAITDIEDVFDRWEEKILYQETSSLDPASASMNSFEQEFSCQEQQEQLLAELEAL